jgi:hypothetical protein
MSYKVHVRDEFSLTFDIGHNPLSLRVDGLEKRLRDTHTCPGIVVGFMHFVVVGAKDGL